GTRAGRDRPRSRRRIPHGDRKRSLLRHRHELGLRAGLSAARASAVARRRRRGAAREAARAWSRLMAAAAPSPVSSRRDRRRREIHERILDAAIGLFGRKGFTATTALEIADTADVAEKTFYNHFPTKQHLIEELARRTLQVTQQLLSDARSMPGTTVDR